MRVYLDPVMNVFVQAYQGAIVLTETDFEYSESLKECLIGSTTCILHGINTEDKPEPEFIKYIQGIFEFVRLSCEKKCRPTVEYVKDSLMLLLDISNFFKKETRTLMRSPFILEMVNIMKLHNKEGQQNSTIEYARHIMQQI
jgi:hypothetical protein